jgi:heme exporter protein D
MDSAFFAMGGYAAFIWPAYGATAAILIGLLVASWRGLRAREAELKLAESANAARPRRATRAGA